MADLAVVAAEVAALRETQERLIEAIGDQGDLMRQLIEAIGQRADPDEDPLRANARRFIKSIRARDQPESGG